MSLGLDIHGRWVELKTVVLVLLIAVIVLYLLWSARRWLL
jgi:hypothetical protein